MLTLDKSVFFASKIALTALLSASSETSETSCDVIPAGGAILKFRVN